MNFSLGQYLFINSEILGNHSGGIDTAFATMIDQPTHNLEILGQPNLQTCLVGGIFMCCTLILYIPTRFHIPLSLISS